MDFSILISNPLINAGVISWISAQVIKTILDAVKHRSFNRQRLAGAGGCPVPTRRCAARWCSPPISSMGSNPPVFALAFIVALIVMYDATGVRWAAGLHAKAINQIVEYLDSGDVNDQEKDLNDLIPKLNESLGHRVIEVICGAALGIVIAFLGQIIRQGGFFPVLTEHKGPRRFPTWASLFACFTSGGPGRSATMPPQPPPHTPPK